MARLPVEHPDGTVRHSNCSTAKGFCRLFFDDFEREDLVLIPFEYMRGDLRLREVAHVLAKLLLIIGEGEFHGWLADDSRRVTSSHPPIV